MYIYIYKIYIYNVPSPESDGKSPTKKNNQPLQPPAHTLTTGVGAGGRSSGPAGWLFRAAASKRPGGRVRKSPAAQRRRGDRSVLGFNERTSSRPCPPSR